MIFTLPLVRPAGQPVSYSEKYTGSSMLIVIAGGTNYGNAKAGDKNAQRFHDEGICALLAWGVDVFYFEAFDEPWKPDSIGDNGEAADETHWGMYNADRSPKFDVSCKNI